MRLLITAIVLLLAAPQTPASYRAEIDEYRAARVAELTAPDGWLAVRGLFWLHEGANTAGSDPASEIRLPPRTAKRLGVFTLAGGQISFAADPAASVTAGGKPITTITFSRGAESRQHAISGWSGRGQIRESRLGLHMLILLGKLRGLVECRSGLGRLFGFQILIAAPATDRGDDQDRAGDNQNRILLPQLLELFATQILIDFIK